ncbi:hypothetical protein LXA43DRAFT_1151493 [Ganoderma leucocontextum]|nr:hypothetical protein LXA43DRAFT_1151493 [Ganoderma leucocontextum]
MSTPSETTTLNRLSSILLALRRMRRPSPEKILHHLDDPVPSDDDDYDYLDALATLCSFAAQCDSVSAVVEHDTQSNRLYLATSPSPPSTLRDRLPALIDVIQKLCGTRPSSSETGGRSELEGSLNHNTPTQNFIIEVYRVCHAKLLDAVRAVYNGTGKLVAK